jgi:GNAT superfamily N-acetyltransferase
VTDHRVHSRDDAAALINALAGWDAAGTYVSGLHAGDVGWFLRLPDERAAGRVHGWWSDGGLVAAVVVEDVVARPRIAPHLVHDAELATAVADLLDALPGEDLWSDAAHGSQLRQVLALRGWKLDPDPWIALYAAPSAGEAAPGVASAGTDPEARVAVQRSGFAGSTFDRASWDRLAALPAYDPELDLVLGNAEGIPVAAGTAWLAGSGTAIIEPLAVHPDHRRLGYATMLTRDLVARCCERGASGVSVCTPADNIGAVAAYRAAAFRPVETIQAMVRPGR